MSLELYQFAPAFNLPNASPFCMKVETWLRMAGLPFTIVPPHFSQFNKAPKGKMPFIRDTATGTYLADSSAIIAQLSKAHAVTLDDWLSPEQNAVGLAFQRLMEENLYWAVLYSRWVPEAAWDKTRAAFFGDLPAPLKLFVPALARRGMKKSLHGHGMGRHSEAEIMAIGRRDISALATFLADKPFILGDQPCSLDASAYAFIANLSGDQVPDSALKQHALTFPQFGAYVQRMQARYFTS